MGKTSFISSIMRRVRGGSNDSDTETGRKNAKQVIPVASQSSDIHPGVVDPSNGTDERDTEEQISIPGGANDDMSIEDGYKKWEQYIKERFEEKPLTPWESYINLTHVDHHKEMVFNYAFEHGLHLDMSLDASTMLQTLDDWMVSHSKDTEENLRYLLFKYAEMPAERLEATILQECQNRGAPYSGPAIYPLDEYLRQLKEIEETLPGHIKQQEQNETDEPIKDHSQQQAPPIKQEIIIPDETEDPVSKKKKSIKKRFLKILTLSKVRNLLKAKKG